MPDGGRLLDFWGTGTWMPLLAALRRLEAASSHGGPGGGSRSCLHPQLADLKKTAGSIAALLQRDCMPDPPEADAPDNSAGVSIFFSLLQRDCMLDPPEADAPMPLQGQRGAR